MSDRAPVDLDKWNAEVREPAEKASEGKRILKSKGAQAEASYEVAPLPDGRWAVKVQCAYFCGDNHGVMIPWRTFPTRDACVAFFLEQARAHFKVESYPVTGAQKKARRAMQALLDESILSVEPTPETAPTEAIAAPAPPTEKPPVQGLLFGP